LWIYRLEAAVALVAQAKEQYHEHDAERDAFQKTCVLYC